MEDIGSDFLTTENESKEECPEDVKLLNYCIAESEEKRATENPRKLRANSTITIKRLFFGCFLSYVGGQMIAPIALRELLVASRRRGSWRIRLATTLCGFFVAMFALLGARSVTSAGQGIFNVLTFVVFVYAAGAGFLLTTGCIAEERREGTFGLLYLTPLSAWDVILGKLASSSLQGVFGLVAVVPMLFLSVLAGGVTGEQLFQVVIVLAATLFLSLSAGILASASAQSRRGAIGLTAFLMIAPLAGGWIGVLISGVFGFVTEQEKKRRADVYWMAGYFSLAVLLICMFARSGQALLGNPIAAIIEASRGASQWAVLNSVGAISATGLFYLFCATLCTEWYRAARQIVAEKVEDERHVEELFFPGLRSKGRVGDEPAHWLLRFLQSTPFTFYVALVLMILINLGHGLSPTGIGMNFGFILVLFPYLLFNFTLARFCAAPFHILERSGFLETLMTTPLRIRELAGAQRKIFWKTLKIPFLILVVASVPGLLAISMRGFFGGMPGFMAIRVVNWIVSWIVFWLHLEALGLLAMLQGSRGRKPLSAAGRATAMVMIPELAMNIAAPVLWNILFGWSEMPGFFIAQLVAQIAIWIFFSMVIRNTKAKIGIS